MLNEISKKRCDLLFKLGLKFNGESYVGTQENNNDFNFHHTEILYDTDEEWNKKIASIEEEIKRRSNVLG